MERLKQAYLALSPRLRARVPIGLEDWVRAEILPRFRSTGPAATLEAKLWGGFSRAARAELAALADAPGSRPRDAAEAALALARWHGAAALDPPDFAAALARIRQARAIRPAFAGDRRQRLMEAQFLLRLGRAPEARALLAPGRTGTGRGDVSAGLLRATAWNPAVAADGDPEAALAALNAVLAAGGLSPLARGDAAAPLGLDNLRGLAAPGSAPEGPLVSILMPFRDAARTLPAALGSLLAQTHAALEIVAIDDASRDAGPDIVADLARTDPRIRLIRLPENLGGYAARNRGLTATTGGFVTVHDADDWSHPEKIARLLARLRNDPDAAYAISDWARADDALGFWGTWRPGPNLVSPDFSALLVRREAFDRAGLWDTARVSADREFAARLDRLAGRPPPKPVLAGLPLAFGRSGPASLTRTSATHAATLLHGLRRDYREAADLWHAGLAPGGRVDGAPPFFPAPRTLRPSGPEPRHDLVFIADFNLKGGTFHSAMHMIRAARADGRDVALLHLRRYDLDPTRPLDPALRRFAAEAGIRLVSPGERLRAETVVLTYPALFDQAMDRFPEIDHDRLAVVVNQMAERDREGTDRAYDPARVRAHLVENFGSEGVWLPISGRVRALMEADPRYPAPGPDTWMPLIDRGLWEARPARWRGGDPGRTGPVIGRHGRDHPLKWPRDPKLLAAAYCVDRPGERRFLGGGRVARARLGRRPPNWHEAPFDAIDPRDFLSGPASGPASGPGDQLDIFLHWPDPDYVEEFGRAAMEAMAVGLPVILSPDFAPSFGDAALYAEADAVWPLAERLWCDRAFWEARAAAGRAFVAANCGYDAFPPRLARLAAAVPEPA